MSFKAGDICLSTKDANWSFNKPETVEIDDLGPISYEPLREHN
jgi:hypothetical protein